MKTYTKKYDTGGLFKREVLTKKDKEIVNDFVKIFNKYKRTISPLRMVELIGSAIDQTKIY